MMVLMLPTKSGAGDRGEENDKLIPSASIGSPAGVPVP